MSKTKKELYEIIQNYRKRVCPKININSSKAELQRAVLRIENPKLTNFSGETKTTKTKKTKTTKTKAVQVISKDDLKKKIKKLFSEYKDISKKIDKTDSAKKALKYKNEGSKILKNIKELKIKFNSM